MAFFVVSSFPDENYCSGCGRSSVVFLVCLPVFIFIFVFDIVTIFVVRKAQFISVVFIYLFAVSVNSIAVFNVIDVVVVVEFLESTF